MSAGFADRIEAPTLMEFPDQATLTSIIHDGNALTLTWQEGAAYWARARSRDYQEQEALDLYEYRAHRRVDDRVITRFEVRLDLGLAALFIPNPVQDEEHEKAREEAMRVIDLLIGRQIFEANQFDISTMSRNLDQRTMSVENSLITTQRSRLTAGGAHVEFAADSPDKSYGEEGAVRDVRRSIRDQQVGAFRGTGAFLFHPGAGSLRRQLRVGLYGRDHRIRLWAQMSVDEVWSVLTQLASYQ